MLTLPADAPTVVHDVLDVSMLVHYLRLETRTRPVVVLTVAPRERLPHVSASEIFRAAEGGVDVVTVQGDELTRAMSERLGDPRAGVYRGACRVYPPGNGWERDPYGIPLRMARNKNEIRALPGLLAEDIRQARVRGAGSGDAAASSSDTVPHGSPSGSSHRRTVPQSITSADEAERLAGFLHSSGRGLPAVVVSWAAGATEAFADVEQLERDLEGLALVFEITTVEASWAFGHAVPEGCQVYGGAVRTYPVGTVWEEDPYVSPLHLAHSRADRNRTTRELIGDVMRMASAGSLAVSAVSAAPAVVSGKVEGIVAERGLVKLHGKHSQRPGVLWPELVEPGVPADRLFAKGMRIDGALDPDSRRIDVRQMRREPGEALSGYRPGDTILVKVLSVDAERCMVEAFPGHAQSITADNVIDEESDLRDLINEGEVLGALLVEVEESGEWLLSVAEAAEPSDAVAAPSILAGGPPWLVPDEIGPAPVGVEPAPSVAPVVPEAGERHPVAGATVELVEALQQEKGQLVTQLQQERAEKDKAKADLQLARTQLRKAKRRKDRSQAAGPDDSALFEDPAEQLDFEIKLAWARMTLPSEKEDLPLRKWAYGPDFLPTLAELEGVSRDKVVEVIVHVLTGRDTELASRELHQLRTGLGANDATVVRDRGEICWRVNLQSNTPGARRLHYWSCADGSVELSSVRVHDDFRP